MIFWLFKVKIIVVNSRLKLLYFFKYEKNEMYMSHKICLIGSGNLGTNLGLTLYQNGFEIKQVISRTLNNATCLAKQIGAEYSDNIDDIIDECDTIIFSVSDDAIPELIKGRQFGDKILIHTAGSVKRDVFKDVSDNYGVLYPLQSFSQHSIAEFKNAPVLIEGNNNYSFSRIRQIADQISSRVYEVNYSDRLKLHTAAVFACNFTNYMYQVANDIIEDLPIDFSIFKPLIRETTEKVIKTLDPVKSQTGPALRNDHTTMNKHLELISNDQELSELYKLISNRIFESKNQRNNDRD